MEVVKRDSFLWSYLTPELRGLIVDGETLLDLLHYNPEDLEKVHPSDYSFLVFSFAKAYEGFLKKFFFDLGLIKQHEYYGDDIRIGRILNPMFVEEKSNVFHKICDKSPEGKHISKILWKIWKKGRNNVFHYFPQNFRKLDYTEAYTIIQDIVESMDAAVTHCRV